MVFPSEDDSLTPMDFIAKGSEVTCGLECKSIWLGAQGWGISWELKQCVVKPKSSESSEGLLQLDVDGFKSSSPKQSVQSAEEVKPAVAAAAVPVQSTKSSTYVEDSEDEEETKPTTTAKEDSEPESEPEAKVEEEEEEKPKVFVKKTVVKKADDSTVAKKVSRKKV
jgi:hypothetical protein